MPNYSVVLRTSFSSLDDAIKLYKTARNQIVTPSIDDIPGIIGYASNYVFQENGHQRELNIAAHVINSGLYSSREIAEVIVLGGHQSRMPKNDRRDMIDVVDSLKPWIIGPAIASFEDIINSLDVTIRAEFLARRSPRSSRWGLGWFGPLIKYDMALRIAYAHYKSTGSAALMPNAVYLNQGAKTGAEKLLGIKVPAKMAAPAINPAFAVCGLSEEEIEDFLCVMHPFLTVGGVVSGQVTQVICAEYHWLINRRLVSKIKKNHSRARLDIMIINKLK